MTTDDAERRIRAAETILLSAGYTGRDVSRIVDGLPLDLAVEEIERHAKRVSGPVTLSRR